MAELALDAARARVLEHLARQLRLDQAGEDRVHPDAGARERVGGGLREIVHRRLAGAVGDRAGVRPQRRGRRGEDDRAVALRRHVRAGIFDGEEAAHRIDAIDLHPLLDALLEQGRVGSGDADIGEENLESAEFARRSAARSSATLSSTEASVTIAERGAALGADHLDRFFGIRGRARRRGRDAPSRAKRIALALPMPLPPPVTTARLSFEPPHGASPISPERSSRRPR